MLSLNLFVIVILFIHSNCHPIQSLDDSNADDLEEYIDYVEDSVDYFFDFSDENRDGFLDAKEFGETKVLNDPDYQDYFNLLKKHEIWKTSYKDGKIDKEEVSDMIKQFLSCINVFPTELCLFDTAQWRVLENRWTKLQFR